MFGYRARLRAAKRGRRGRSLVVSEERGASNGRTVFEGSLLRVRVERARLPDGEEVEREVVRHPGAAGVLPVVSGRPEADGAGEQASPTILLLRQYRHAAAETLWEIPAGTLEPGETPEACAVRELEEEAGLAAREDDLVELGRPFTSPGFTDEVIHLFLAPRTRAVSARPEPGEQLERVRLSLERALGMAAAGEIRDAKTLCALLLAARATAGVAQPSE